MRKTVYVLNIGNYMPDLCSITIPTIEAWARRIGAKIGMITERKFPEWPVTYEKLQIHELSREDDWSLYIDADTVISPALGDPTTVFPPTHVGVFMAYTASMLFPSDNYFARDGRNLGLATNFIVTNPMTNDLWTPFQETAEDILPRLAPTDKYPHRPHLVDEYCLSRNLARYGLKYSGIVDMHLNHFLHLSVTVENVQDAICSAQRYKKRWRMS